MSKPWDPCKQTSLLSSLSDRYYALKGVLSVLRPMTNFLIRHRVGKLTRMVRSVRGQTDIREIHNDTLPLWFDHLDPAKINMGLAYYGRGIHFAQYSACYERYG